MEALSGGPSSKSRSRIRGILPVPLALQVLGLDQLRTKEVKSTHALVLKHIASVRKMRNLGPQEATICFVLESNLAFESQHIIHAVQMAQKQNPQLYRNWMALLEGAQNTVGWLTTNERKESMCLQLREALSTNRISFSNEFFSSTGAAEAKEQLKGELREFSILVDPPKTPFGKVRKTFTGKTGGRQDDMAIALQLAIAGARVFYESERYQKFRPEYPVR